MNPYLAGLIVPVIISIFFGTKKSPKKRGVPVESTGDRGFTVRNVRFDSPVETHWPGIETLASLFEQSCGKFTNLPLFGTRKLISKETEVSNGRSFEKLHLGDYEWVSYGAVFKAVCDFASGLMNFGHGKGERVAIFADTRAEWQITLQGCFRQNITVVTIYSTLGEEALCHSLNETEVTTVICGQKELKKLIDISNQLDTVKRIIYINEDGISKEVSLAQNSTNWELKSFEEVQKLGNEILVEPSLPLPSDVAVIMYTSGSTGLPKGVMMTHKNVLSVVSAVMTIVPHLGTKDVYLAYLPLAHILELAAESVMVAAGVAIGYGSPLTLVDTSNKIKKGTKGDASVLKPTLMTAVPAILDRIRDAVRKNVDAKGGNAKKLFEISYERRLSAINGSWFGAWGVERILWDFLVFKKVKAILGGNVRFLLSGGAPLSADTQRFINICLGLSAINESWFGAWGVERILWDFLVFKKGRVILGGNVRFLLSGAPLSTDTQRFINICLGAPIGQGYGLTETCAGGSFSEHDDSSVGRVGAPLPCAFVKLIDWAEGGYLITDKSMPRGEIVIGGPCVTLGYFKNEDKTNEVYKTDEKGMRWFYTGDIGQFHSDGCLEIIDRKKDIVKLQHGEYVSLGKVEAALSVSPYVDNIMVHADPFHSYCVALVVAAHPALQNWAQNKGIQFTDFADLCKNPETVKEVQSSLVKAAKEAKLEKFEIPAKIELLHEPWTLETGLVTAALKLKREVIRKTFAETLANLYTH